MASIKLRLPGRTDAAAILGDEFAAAIGTDGGFDPRGLKLLSAGSGQLRVRQTPQAALPPRVGPGLKGPGL